jgi:hypothetical protein
MNGQKSRETYCSCVRQLCKYESGRWHDSDNTQEPARESAQGMRKRHKLPRSVPLAQCTY